MKWVFAINQESLENFRDDWPRLIRAAVCSARENTTLEPWMIYDGAETAFIQELRRLGVNIIRHRLSFYDFIVNYQQANHPDKPNYLRTASGAFLRVDLPLLFANDEFVLYTDCDVMFLKEPCVKELQPARFACAPEGQRGMAKPFNTGVMLMNVRALRDDHASFCKFIQDNYANLHAYDQGAYQIYYEGRNDTLADELNWKPYWGLNDDAQIVHFHGPKPRVALGFLTNPRFAASAAHRQLFDKNPKAYEAFVRQWSRFQTDSHSIHDGGREASPRAAARLVPEYPDPADCPEFLRVMSRLNARLATTGEKIEGNICYLNGTLPDELLARLPTTEPNHIIKRKNIAAVARQSTMMLEVGLNGGHSALLSLQSNPNLTFVAVDIFQHKYTEQAANFLREQFPRRFHYFSGDSRDVLPRMALETPKLRFDAIHVDGGHAENLAYADIGNALRFADKNAFFILDDLQAPWLARIFEECMILGHFRPIVGDEFAATPLHEVVRVS